MLVFDTNVLLSSLSLFADLVESRKWSIIIPLPVITELDGLSKNVGTDLSVSAVAAISYLEQKIKSHPLHLKIQTSKGNYLNDLLIRTEMVNFKDPELTSRNMDDLILNIATFQLDQFAEKADVAGGAKVLLVTYDRNLRVRSRARGIEAADEKEVSAALCEV
jgi:predicted ribonuclease YlaK